MGVDAIYKDQDDGIPYRNLNKDLEKKIAEDKAKG